MEEIKFDDVFGFRFLDTLNSSFYELFAIGHQRITHDDKYEWNGLNRVDGPLLLFQYTISGFGHFELNGEIHKITPGKAFMIDIPSKHMYYLSKASRHWEVIFILFRPSNIMGPWQELINKMGHIVKLPVESTPIVLLQRMIHFAKKNNIQDGFKASSMVYQFVMELFRYSQIYKTNRAFWNEKVIEAVENMECHYNSLQSLEEIADSVGLSKYYFSRLFLKTTGSTPIEYLTKIRIKKSVELLSDSDMTIDQIAKLVGYSNGSYFIKVFRQWIGYPPGEFRQGKEITSFNHFTFD